MSRLTTATLSCMLLLASAAASANTFQIVEQAIESSTLSATVPRDAGGKVIVKKCLSCQPFELQLTARSKFLIGGAEVAFHEFSSYVTRSGERQLDVFYDDKSRTVTRLMVYGSRPAAPVRQHQQQ